MNGKGLGNSIRMRRHRILVDNVDLAVEAFLARRIPWLAIAEVNRKVLESWLGNVATVADVLEADRTARARARAVVDRLAESG